MSIFIQDSDSSIKSSFLYDQKVFTALSVGVRLREYDEFTYKFVKRIFEVPLFFVISTVFLIGEQIREIEQHQIGYVMPDRSEWASFKVESDDQLKLITTYAEWSACNGLVSFMFQGENISHQDVYPIVRLSHPTEFPNLNWAKITTFMDIHEVGYTVITRDSEINGIEKLIDFIPEKYKIDLEDSDN